MSCPCQTLFSCAHLVRVFVRHRWRRRGCRPSPPADLVPLQISWLHSRSIAVPRAQRMGRICWSPLSARLKTPACCRTLRGDRRKPQDMTPPSLLLSDAEPRTQAHALIHSRTHPGSFSPFGVATNQASTPACTAPRAMSTCHPSDSTPLRASNTPTSPPVATAPSQYSTQARAQGQRPRP